MSKDQEYMRQYMAQRRARRRQQLIELSGGKCEAPFFDDGSPCGSTDRLEFDHIDRNEKSFGLSGRGLDGPWDRIIQEHAKCQLLCYQCHRIKTIAAGDTGGGHNKLVDWPHGTVQRYTANKCRCLDCKYARMLYRSKEIRYREVVKAPEWWRRGYDPR